ncbi:HAD family hydrolase [Robertkochia aurantiaca]|uniref:HAD family hydrolase n=1 Tax=Robertkochia aurantiaca TaxID=2873700 RepID=UPI001CCEA38F|nr:HAD family hydrolase [Robertkochia sp. 3YJGBD-33]
MKLIKLLSILLILYIYGCKSPEKQSANPAESPGSEKIALLPSWNEGPAKQQIMEFVRKATTEGDSGFIPVSQRIAVFDNDGTLWAEKPVYFQLLFAIDRVKDLADEHPEWQNEQPFKAILENDMETLSQIGHKELFKIIMATHSDTTAEEFRNIVNDWMAKARHPKTDRPFTEMVYQPMLELIDYLKAHDFKTYIVSGGGIEFMRAWVEDVYGTPPSHVIGSSIKSAFAVQEGKPVIKRLPDMEFLDDKEGKPVAINRFIGKVPVFAAGNSDGDLQMLQYSAGKVPSLQLYVHHTDSIRECAYDRESKVGKLDKGLDMAREKGWVVVDMAKDWDKVFMWEE